MGKGGLFLTFLLVLLLLTGAWYAFAPRYTAPPDRPMDPPDADEAGTEEPPPAVQHPELPPVTVTGLVFDGKTREPVAGARVELFELATVTTNGRGVWSVELARKFGIRRVEVEGEVTADGYLGRKIGFRIPWEGATGGARTTLLSPVGACVSGRVLFADGQPAEGAEVRGSVTGRDGRYGPVPVGVGRILLYARLAGHPQGRGTIDVEPGEVRDLTADIWIPVSTPYSGVIRDDTGKPLPGARVSLGPGGSESTATGEEGEFSFPGTSGGRRQLEFRGEGWRPFSCWIQSGVPLEVTLVKGGVLDGVIREADETPAGPGWEVELLGRFDSGGMYRTVTGADGGFRMTLPVGGPLEIEVQRQGVLCGRFVVEVVPDSVTEREFTLPAPEILAVRVVSAEDGVPVPDAIVFGGWPEPVATKTDALGGADIPLPARTLSQTHIRMVVHHPDYLALPFVESSTKFLPGEVRVVKLVPRSAIRVNVVDGEDRPVPGASIIVSWHGAPSLVNYSGPDGTADTVAPRGRLVSILANHPQFGVQTTNATAPAEVTIRLAPTVGPGKKRILVLDETGAPIRGAWVQGYGFKRHLADETGRVEVPAHLGWLHVLAPGCAASYIDIEEATADGEIEVRLAPGHDLAVTVVDEAGRGVRDVKLHVTNEMDRSIPCPASPTDGSGKAFLPGLPENTSVMISASHYGFAATRAWVPAGSKATELRLPRLGVIRVRLAGGRWAGQPFRFRWRTTDRAPYLDDYGSGKEGTIPDASGVVQLAAPPGRVALLFSCAGGAPRIYPDVVVPAAGKVQVAYDFPEAGKLDLRVRDDEDGHIEGARIFVAGINEHIGWTTSRGRIPDDRRGRFPVGKVRLSISSEGRPTVWTEAIDLSVPDPVSVVMPKGSVVDGVLVDGEGRAVAGRVRVLTETDRPASWTVTDVEGRFRLDRPLAPGDHRFVIRAPGHRPRIATATIGGEPKTTLTLSVD